jgi:hypothetical protein
MRLPDHPLLIRNGCTACNIPYHRLQESAFNSPSACEDDHKLFTHTGWELLKDTFIMSAKLVLLATITYKDKQKASFCSKSTQGRAPAAAASRRGLHGSGGMRPAAAY